MNAISVRARKGAYQQLFFVGSQVPTNTTNFVENHVIKISNPVGVETGIFRNNKVGLYRSAVDAIASSVVSAFEILICYEIPYLLFGRPYILPANYMKSSYQCVRFT